MKELVLTNEELEQYNLFNSGYESRIYSKDNNNLLKVYYEITDEIIKKIEFFHNLNLDNVCNPNELLKIDGKIVGYSMTNKKEYSPISNYKHLPIFEKITLLEKIKIILKNLHDNNIIFGDLNINNILCNGEDIYLADIVNAKTSEHNFTENSTTMYFYKQEQGKMDYNLDNYMLNILTIYLLNDEIEYKDIFKIILETLMNKFNKKDTIEIIGLTDNFKCMDIGYQMLDPKKGIEELLIDNIDKDLYKNIDTHKHM